MSVIVQQPDSLSFAGNLKKFVVTSAVAVALQLNKGAEQILNEIYQPSAGSIVEIDLRTVIDKVLSLTLPGTNLITEQSSGFADFTATIDGTAVAFRVIKGGVLELGSMAGDFVNEHFLTWQIQDKQILQHQPEWLTVYTNADRNLKAKAYYQDNANASMLLTALAANKLLAVDVSWASINSLFVKKNPIAWEVWFEDLAGTRLSYVQRYCLRNPDDEEKIFIWANTMGGIDSISLTGSAEDDKKLEHLIAEMGDESLQEYQTDKKREIKQSTGFLTVDESRWIEDFFYSGRRYLVGEDGAVRSIVLASSKIVGSTADDLFDYEFNYRLSSESQLLNLERSFDSLPALEVPVDFFLTELLSGLPVAQYSDGLLMAVQSPFAQAWQKLSMAQLWGYALPGLVDGTTISVVNGKLQVNGVSGGVGVSKWGDLTEKPFNSLSNLFSVSPEGILTLSNNYAAANHTHPYLSDSDARIGNWTTAYNWGDHAGKYRPIAWIPAWADITNKPEWLNRMSWDGTATVVSSDLHVTGKLVVDGTIQFFGSGAGGGTGGGGASALWELTDVADDMVNSIYGDLPMYNGTHFARYNISNLATVGHGHTIAQVTGLQGSLDGKQSLLGYTPYYSANFVAGVNYSAPHSHPYLSDSDARIANWSTAFGWGNHAGLYRPIGYVPSWGEITSKPTWTEKFGWDGAAVTLSTDMHITGKLVVDGTIQFFGSGAGGTGGSGSTTLWGLSDVDDDVQNSIYGDLIMYNGTHWARINQSVLAPAVHSHTIGQVTGLQGVLDGKMAIHTHPYLSDSDARIINWNTGYTHSQSAHYTGADIYAWAKQVAKPDYTKAEVGLSLVNNTADLNKSVAYAVDAGKLIGMNWIWAGQTGQPDWLWGCTGGVTNYVYNPSNFSVAYAANSGLLNSRSDYWHPGNLTPSNYLLKSAGLANYLTGRLGIYSTASTTYGDLVLVQQSIAAPSFVRGLQIVHPNGTGATGGYIGISMTGQKTAVIQVGDDIDMGSLSLQPLGGGVLIPTNIASSSYATGSLTVGGGVGIAGNINSLGYVVAGNAKGFQNQSYTTGLNPIWSLKDIPSIGISLYSGVVTDFRIHIGNASAPQFKVDENGNIAATGNIVGLGTMQFYTASDRRLKTDFEAITNPIEKIKSLTGYFFNYNDEGMRLGGYVNRRDIGLIAQDVDAILPEACGTLWGTNYMGYKADKLIPLLVEAIKQQQNEIDELKRQRA